MSIRILVVFVLWITPASLSAQNQPEVRPAKDCGTASTIRNRYIFSLQHGRFGCPGDGKRNLSFHVGPAIPHGVLSDKAGPGLAVTADYVFAITPTWSWDVRFGHSRFPGTQGQPNTRVLDLSVNLDYAVLRKRPWIFVNGGLGSYFVDALNPSLGFNAGAGIGYPLNSRLVGEVIYNFHSTVNATNNVRFSKVQVGVIYSF